MIETILHMPLLSGVLILFRAACDAAGAATCVLVFANWFQLLPASLSIPIRPTKVG